MVDREARDELARVLEAYMADEITAFQLDEELFGRQWPDDDETLMEVVFAVWGCYDDFEDHSFRGGKPVWDLLQRFVLLLKSDDSVVSTRRLRITLRQPVAMACLAAFVVALTHFGWSDALLAVCVAIGIVSVLLSKWRKRSEKGTDARLPVTVPYGSVAELLGARRRVTAFRKRPYPRDRDARNRRRRSPLQEVIDRSRLLAAWLHYSPLPLLFQALPEFESELRVIPAAPSEIVHGRPIPPPPPYRQEEREAPQPEGGREVLWDKVKLLGCALAAFAVILAATFAAEALFGAD
jgi:hypothetical protein